MCVSRINLRPEIFDLCNTFSWCDKVLLAPTRAYAQLQTNWVNVRWRLGLTPSFWTTTDQCYWTQEIWFWFHISDFWLIWCNTKRNLYNHDFSVVDSCHDRHLVSASSACVHSPPSHRIKDRNFIFGMNMHMCPLCMHIKYSVTLTYSF